MHSQRVAVRGRRSHAVVFAASIVVAVTSCDGPGGEWGHSYSMPDNIGTDTLRPVEYREPQHTSRPVPVHELATMAIIGDSLSFGRITSLRVIGDLLIATDRMFSPHVTIIDVPSYRILTRFGKHGRGPGEFQDAMWVAADPEALDHIWVYDYQTRRFSQFSVQPNDAEKARHVKDILLRSSYPPSQPVWTSSGILTNGYFPDHTMLQLAASGDPNKWIIADPAISQRDLSHLTGRIRLNRTRVAASPSRGRLALAYQAQNRLDIFRMDNAQDMNRRLLVTTQGPRDVQPDYELVDVERGAEQFVWTPNNELGYVWVDASEEYILALFCGTCAQAERLPDLVHVFDWNGVFVEEIKLDRQVWSIAVSQDGGILFGAVDEPFPSIAAWNLGSALSTKR